MAYRILVASYTRSVYTIEFNPTARTLTRLSSVEVGHHPSWIVAHPEDNSLIFSCVEERDGKIVALKYDSRGVGTVVVEAPSGGMDPCALHASNKELFIANYSSGRVCVMPISCRPPYLSQIDATITFSGTGPNAERQESSHPHQVYSHGDSILVPDLGGDRVYTLEQINNSWTPSSSISFAPGSGPRHVAYYDGVLYTLLELSSCIAAHRDDVLINTVPTMFNPPPAPTDMLAAEILIPSPNASFPTPYIYLSNRNDPSPEGDIISIFAIEANGAVKQVKEVRSGLKHARGMVFGGSDNKWLIIGGALGGGVKMFERTNGGNDLLEVAASIDVAESPTGFLWV